MYANILSFQNVTGEYLKQIGPVVFMVNLLILSGFGSAYVIPIPALRVFVIQSSILIVFIAVFLVILFPAITSVDIRRKQSNRVDLFCCCTSYVTTESDEKVTNIYLNDLSKNSKNNRCTKKSFDAKVNEPFLPSIPYSRNDKANLEAGEGSNVAKINRSFAEKLSLNYFAEVMSTLLNHKTYKVIVLISFMAFSAVCLMGIQKVRYGLELNDIVPKGSTEHDSLKIQSKYFNFFAMCAVTQGNFEYPTNQKLLLEYHHAYTRVDKIIKNDDGGLTDFWLIIFRDWLIGLQQTFDKDFASGFITQEGWNANASDNGILAYKLLVQTGRVDNPIDKSLVTRIKLVDANGIINPKAFYNYLTAWVSIDQLAYSSSQASFKPDPKPWNHYDRDTELRIPKSQPLKYAQIPFYLNKMNSTEEIIATVKEIRAISQKFEERGLPNFPNGVPFTFWEQYLLLPLYTCGALLIAFALVFVIVSLSLVNAQIGAIVVFSSMFICFDLYGLMGHFDVRLNAVPAVIIILSIGIVSSLFIPTIIVSYSLCE